MTWFLIACAVFGLVMGLSSPRNQYRRRYYGENEYDYDGGSSDCGCDYERSDYYDGGNYGGGGGDRE